MDPLASALPVRHGETRFSDVEVRSYSLPLKDGDTFLGDLASGSEFRKVLRRERHRIDATGRPPFGSDRTHELTGDDLDAALRERNSTAEGRVIENAIGAFSQRFATVLAEFLETAEWRGTQRVVCGGGLMEGDVGAELVRRTQSRLRVDRPDLELRRLHHAPDEAGMIGWTVAAPAGALDAGEAFVAVDIGGTNVRWGIVRSEHWKDGPRSASIIRHDKWCHAEEEVSREAVVERIAEGIRGMVREAQSSGIRLAPLVGLSCPGIVCSDGRLARGGQNLPGDWSDGEFELPKAIAAEIGTIAGRRPAVVLHNDAVVQALSELPEMRDVERWAAVTLGTGLGNCSFQNH